MSRTRSSAKKPKPTTGAAAATTTTTGVLRRSRRLLQLKNNESDYCSVGLPRVRENARTNSSKPRTGAATATPTCLPRRSQRLLQSKVKSLYHCSTAARENAQNAAETATTTVLRRSQRILLSKTGRLKSCCLDGNMQQGCGLLKESSRRTLGKSISPPIVRLNFDDVSIAECNDPIGNIGENPERRTTRSLSASRTAQNRQGNSELRIADNNLRVQQGRDSKSLSSLAVNINKIIQKDNDASKRCMSELEEMSSESDSTPVAKLVKRCFKRTSKCNKRGGVKRKQNQVDVGEGTDHGWTKEQERALQRAYIAAKPTPNFWKKVARLVPGKSSQECFDKVNSENLTPCVQPPRSRCKRKTLSPQLEISFSNSELLPERKNKRPNRRKSHINQKMVRHLMRKNTRVGPDNNAADFFCVLEPTVSPLPKTLPISPLLSTPTMVAEEGSSLSYNSRSLSGQKKSKSRFSGKAGIPIASPPVLKPVKNMALHDKYVDQLHAREAKRKAASTLPKGNANELHLKNKDVVRAAKEALISDARDAISKFRHSEIYMESCNDSEGKYDDDDDEDEDDENAL